MKWEMKWEMKREREVGNEEGKGSGSSTEMGSGTDGETLEGSRMRTGSKRRGEKCKWEWKRK